MLHSILIETDQTTLQYFEMLVICYVSLEHLLKNHQINMWFLPLQTRVKVRGKRRPQTRAARHLAAQESTEAEDVGSPRGFVAQLTDGATSPDGRQPPLRAAGGAEEAVAAATPTWAGGPVPGMNRGPFVKSVGQPLEDDLFDSGDIFSKGIASQSAGRKAKVKAASSLANLAEGSKDRSPMFPALGETGSDDDLFQSIKPKPAKKTNPFPFLEDEDDLFTDQRGKKNGSKSNSQQGIISKAQDIFEVIGHKNTSLCLVLC